MTRLIPIFLLGASLLGSCSTSWKAQDAGRPCPPWSGDPSSAQILEAFGRQGLRVNMAEAQGVRENVLIALREVRAHGLGNSKVDFSAIEIAHDLNLETAPGSVTVKRVVAALGDLAGHAPCFPRPEPRPRPLPIPPPPPLSWPTYFNDTVNLTNQPEFMNLMARNRFFPVKISWEDIGRSENSVWGDRISDVGIWVRQDEHDASSARLALSVRRDSNFRDKVLMVPSERIKVHVREGGRTVEKDLPQRLAELGLASRNRDRHVIVSNQFAIVPVPAAGMRGAWSGGAPRAAFTFSIYPYGSTNVVITDVIEGSHEAVVGPGTHQELFANIHGQKAPFTASRAEDRQDLLQMERELKAQGMDVDVQRYYLIQIPLRRDARGVQTSQMGTPPLDRAWNGPMNLACEGLATVPQPSPCSPMPSKVAGGLPQMEQKAEGAPSRATAGLERVAIGHGDAEGRYLAGSGYRGARAEEPVRVTVVYFVTPVGKVTSRDMETFTHAFAQWDSKAIWGGSFVTKETD